MLSKLLNWMDRCFIIFKSKVKSTQVADGGSLNYPSILMYLIYLPSLCFQPTRVVVTLWFQQIPVAAETIQCDYTNTKCFWRLLEMAKNIVLVPLKTSSDGILSLDDFNT